MRLRILILDETANWSPDIQERAGKIFGIYLYNPKVAVHCCEFTPSYELTFLNSVAENSPEDEGQREKLYDDLMEGDHSCEPIQYIHCRTVDSLPKIRRGQLRIGTYPYYFWESLEEAKEHWNGYPDY